MTSKVTVEAHPASGLKVEIGVRTTGKPSGASTDVQTVEAGDVQSFSIHPGQEIAFIREVPIESTRAGQGMRAEDL